MASARHPRRGFTLVEMLVVILVIGVLVGLVAPVAFNALSKGTETQLISEIKQLESAIAAFKQYYSVNYLPSQITLSNRLSAMPPQDLQYIKRVWPRIGVVADLSQPNEKYVNWYGPSSPNQIVRNFTVTLRGPQTLTFFLGGARTNGGQNLNDGYLGFSSNPLNPMDLSGTNRVGPFFDFPTDRLLNGTNTTGLAAIWPSTAINHPSNRFPGYADPFKTQKPFFYFSSGAAGNDYSSLDEILVSANPPVGIRPFRHSNGKYINANSFQIISAGKDGEIGALQFADQSSVVSNNSNSSNSPTNWMTWTPNEGYKIGTPSNPIGPRVPDAPLDQLVKFINDNYSNFHPTILGAAQ